MKALIIFITCFFVFCGPASAIGRKHRYNGAPKTEVELMTKVLECLKNKDTFGYYNLFPPFDSLWKMVIHNPDQSPETQRELNKLREHPTLFIDLDPYYNHAIIGKFVNTLKKGEDSGIQWKGIILQRYELQKQEQTRDMEGLQHIIPERFKGFLFVRDMLTSSTFCITIMEIQKINGFYCGGQVLNVLEAHDVDQYLKMERAERKHLSKLQQMEEERFADSIRNDSLKALLALADTIKAVPDSIAIANKLADSLKKKKAILLSVTSIEEESQRLRKEVVDRKYYIGKFDEEIPVELYVRYMKDLSGKVTKYWDALYKFGDMAEYVKLDVSKTDDDKWLFEEPVASMELDLNGKTYTGSWTNGGNQTGYDAELLQSPLSQKKIMELDYLLENGLWGKTDEQQISEKDEDDKKGSKKKKKGKKEKEKEEGDTDKKKEKEDEKPKKESTPKAEPTKETDPLKEDKPKKEEEEKEEKDTAPAKAPKKEDEEKD